MGEPTVRLLRPEEYAAGARIVGQGMLASLADEVLEPWVRIWAPDRAHGAFTGTGELVGVARWMESELAVPGGAVPAALVTAVAVLPNHRRQGHLRRTMEAQLAAMAGQGRAVAYLVAAEWGIYGRYGYGPATEVCTLRLDTKRARFRAPATGSVDLVDAAGLRPHLEASHDARWARTPGAVTRVADTWDHLSGVDPWPNDKTEPGLRRGAIWRDAAGAVQGAVAYTVEEAWTHNVPTGRIEVQLLVGASPEAERELWRHLCSLDWVTTAKVPGRGPDDPLPLFLADARAVQVVECFDHTWARVLDVPAAFAARRAPAPGRTVVEVDDDLGYAAGRWALTLSPEAGSAERTEEPADVAMSASGLGAVYLGGYSVQRLAEAGWLVEARPGGLARLATTLAVPTRPWCPTDF